MEKTKKYVYSILSERAERKGNVKRFFEPCYPYFFGLVCDILTGSDESIQPSKKICEKKITKEHVYQCVCMCFHNARQSIASSNIKLESYPNNTFYQQFFI